MKFRAQEIIRASSSEGKASLAAACELNIQSPLRQFESLNSVGGNTEVLKFGGHEVI